MNNGFGPVAPTSLHRLKARPYKRPYKMLCHDPRISNIRWEFHQTRNVALIMAHLSSKSGDWVDWDEVAAAADDCDWPRDGAGRAIKGAWKP
jgi:hypothetical protein